MQLLRRLKSARNKHAICQQSDIVSFAQCDSFAGLEDKIAGQKFWHRHAAQPDEDGTHIIPGPQHDCARLYGIRRHHHHQVRDHPRPCEVLDGVMGWAEFPVGHATRHAAQFHVVLRITEVNLHLLHGPSRQKTGSATTKWDHARACQSGTCANHVLLGDSDIYEAIGEFFTKPLQFCRAYGVVHNRAHAPVGRRHLLQSGYERVATIE